MQIKIILYHIIIVSWYCVHIPIIFYIEYQLLLYYSETSAKVARERDIGRLASNAVAGGEDVRIVYNRAG